MSPSRARSAPAPTYAPVTPSAATDSRGRRASKKINPAVPVPEPSAARRAPPPTMATPGPACLALAVSSRRAASTCSRAKTTACCDAVWINSSSERSATLSTPGTAIRVRVPAALARKRKSHAAGHDARRRGPGPAASCPRERTPALASCTSPAGCPMGRGVATEQRGRCRNGEHRHSAACGRGIVKDERSMAACPRFAVVRVPHAGESCSRRGLLQPAPPRRLRRT